MIRVIKFGADWCQPCRLMKPTITKLIEKYNTEDSGLVIEEIDVDMDPDSASKYGIRNIPTTIFFLDDEIVNRKVGVISESQIEEIINDLTNYI